MEVPDLVAARLGDEDVLAGVNLGDEDVVCLTATRTLVYSGEGLISDESIAVLPHDVERLSLDEGRRKTTFRLTYVDRQESFSVPAGRADRVLELLLEGILGAAGITEKGESVRGVYRFSELTLIVTDRRLVKHVGAHVWDADYEEFPYADVRGLAFEEGSVATQIVLWVRDRPERIKAPNDEAPKLRGNLQEALFSYHDVASVAELNEKLGGVPEAEEPSNDLTLDAGIDPLDAGGDDTEDEPAGTASVASAAESSRARDDDPGEPAENAPEAVTGADVADRLDALTKVVKRQNELLRKQHKALERLVDELQERQ